MERLTHDADFGFEDWEETLFFVKSDPNGAYNILDIARFQGEAEFDEILKNIALRLAAYEDTGLTPEEVQIQKEAMERMGWFGKMFQRYAGDPRGPIGTLGNAPGEFLVESCIEPARNRQVLKDVDGNTWLPMLQDEFRAMADFIERVQGWIPVEERLPGDSDGLVIMTDGEIVYPSYGYAMFEFDGKLGVFAPIKKKPWGVMQVTHWMPLPKSPKEETHEK